MAVVGFYYFRSGAALMDAIRVQMKEDISLNGEYFLVDAINLMIRSSAKLRIQEVDIWLDAGKPEALLETNRYLLEHGAANSAEAAMRENVTIIPPVYIHPEAELNECVIGPHVAVGRKAVLSRTVIQNSIVEQESEIDQMVLENSIIGRQAGIKGRAEAINIGDNSWIEI